jgi:hypothetical protein
MVLKRTTPSFTGQGTFGTGLRTAVVLLLVNLAACDDGVQMKSVHPPADKRYSDSLHKLTLRPSEELQVSVPFNELWAVHTNPVSRGWPQNEAFVGQAWDRVEARFVLMPEIKRRSPETEQVFHEGSGGRLLRIVLMEPVGGDGDVRAAWKTIRMEAPGSGSAAVAMEAARAAGARPSRLIARHEATGLDEYEGKDEYRSQFFRSGDTVLRCWDPPLSEIRYLCESSFNVGSGVLVNVYFPHAFLPRWQELLAFAKARALEYTQR